MDEHATNFDVSTRSFPLTRRTIVQLLLPKLPLQAATTTE